MGNGISKCLNSRSSTCASSSPIKPQEPMEERQLKVGVVKEEDVILQVNSTGRNLMNSANRAPLYWRESISDVKPILGHQKEFVNLGERKSGLNISSSGRVQDYHELRDKCLRDRTLFEDDAFPANDGSFYMSGRRGPKSFEWLRPSQLTPSPQFITEGVHRFDVIQGELGNCWFLAAVANLTMNSKLFNRVVPHEQTFDKPEYAGIFHFHFWQYGKWIDVVIDDRLPTINGRLMLMHSKDTNEFWSALLEKAYAKLHGSYEALKGGTTSEAMEDFTGGLTEHFDLQTAECPQNLMQIIIKAHQRSSLMGCSIEARDASEMEASLNNGLIRGHAYSITGVKLVELSTSRVQGKIPLIRIRNPWGNEAEWKGAWSDKSREWTVVPEREKQQLGLTFDADGEFWMAFTDFKKNYTRLEICNITPDALDAEETKRWEISYFEGSWISGVSAGGCRNYLNTFHLNPQYLILLVDHDEDDDNDMCTCVVALMQKNRRAKRKMGLDSLTIGYAIYEVKDGHVVDNNPRYQTKLNMGPCPQLLNVDYFKYNASVAKSREFINLREVSGRFQLKPGKYCIIPSTFDPHEEGEFLIRIFTEKPPHSAIENDDHVGIISTPAADSDRNNGVTDSLVEVNKAEPQPPPAINSNAESDDSVLSCFTLLVTTLCGHISSAAPIAAESNRSEVRETVTPTQPAKQTESALQTFFAKLAGEDMEVDARELQEMMNFALKKEYKFEGFSLESCRSLVAMLDLDKTGKLGFDEFTQLWKNIRQWCAVFKRHDIDNSNTISAGELKNAYQEVGLNVNRQILQLIVLRYGIISSSSRAQQQRALTFDDFIHSSMKLKHCIDQWTEKVKTSINISYYGSKLGDHTPTSGGSYTLEEFVERMIYS